MILKANSWKCYIDQTIGSGLPSRYKVACSILRSRYKQTIGRPIDLTINLIPASYGELEVKMP